jgi:hypothetical protein
VLVVFVASLGGKSLETEVLATKGQRTAIKVQSKLIFETDKETIKTYEPLLLIYFFIAFIQT